MTKKAARPKKFKSLLIGAVLVLVLVILGKKLVTSQKPAEAPLQTSPAPLNTPPQNLQSNSVVQGTSATIVWEATHETGDISEWYNKATGNPSQDSGWCERPRKGVSKEIAHSGRYSLKMSIQSYIPKSGCRQFRYPEIKSGESYYYSAWLYLPHQYKIHGWTNLMQLKSKSFSKKGGSELFWALRLFNRENGNLYAQLQWDKEASVPGPTSSDTGGKDVKFDQLIKDFPTQQWVHIEMFVKQSDQFDGHIIVWQDGEEIYNLQNIRTKLPEGFNSWSINAYGAYTDPAKFEVYVDDAVISTERIGTNYSVENN